jgi:hypothetical protein
LGNISMNRSEILCRARSQWLGAVSLLLLTATCAPAMAQTTDRLALVIAQSQYTDPSMILTAPPGDATNMRSVLGDKLHFELFDGGAQSNIKLAKDMRTLITGFAREITRRQKLGHHVTAFVYYSGHGVAGPDNSIENYLLPTSFSLAGNQAIGPAIPTAGYPLSEALDTLQKAGADALYMVFDACRTSFDTKGALNKQGFGEVVVKHGMDLMFSVEAGTTAPDDNSFSAELSRQLVSGHDTVRIFHDTLVNIFQATHRVPLFYDALPYNDVHFSGPLVVPTLVEAGVPQSAKGVRAVAEEPQHSASQVPEAQDAKARAFLQSFVTAWRSGDIAAQDKVITHDFTSTTYKYVKGERVAETLPRKEFMFQKRYLAKLYRQAPDNENARISVSELNVLPLSDGVQLRFEQYFDGPCFLSSGHATWNLRNTSDGFQLSKIDFKATNSQRRPPGPLMNGIVCPG